MIFIPSCCFFKITWSYSVILFESWPIGGVFKFGFYYLNDWKVSCRFYLESLIFGVVILFWFWALAWELFDDELFLFWKNWSTMVITFSKICSFSFDLRSWLRRCSFIAFYFFCSELRSRNLFSNPENLSIIIYRVLFSFEAWLLIILTLSLVVLPVSMDF